MNLIPADPTLSGKPARAKQPAKAPAAATSGANAGDSTLSTTIASSSPAPAPPVISSSPLATPTLTAGVASVTHLTEKLAEYMNAADLKK
ncbi:MAG: guanosine-3',5'-bis(diphosphate) 3'-pyrophosphohydrolase, partial [Pseudomonadota bacterium]